MRILMIEDDEALCDAVGIHLKNNGYDADFCHDGEDGLYYARQKAYDLILLDRMLPGLDGLTVLSTLRREQIHIPVLLLTALNKIGDRVDGLDAGADDYLTKPFATEELLARVRAMLRRTPKLEPEQEILVGDLRFDRMKMLLTGPQNSMLLSKKDAVLLEQFLKNPGRTMTRAQLFAHVWGPDAEVDEANLAWHIHYLRRTFTGVGSMMKLKTVHGVGYLLEPEQC